MATECANLGPTFDAQLEQDTDNAGGALRRLVSDPIQPYITGADLVLVSPDGSLTLCPFAAFPLEGRASFLIEEFPISYLPALGLLPELMNRSPNTTSAGLLLVDDVDYDNADGMHLQSKGENRLRFLQLPKDKGIEVDPILRYFNQCYPGQATFQLTRKLATEQNVRTRIADATVIHLSTHGFCVPLSELIVTDDAQESIQPIPFDPLIAGIALAGANHSSYQDGLFDGILWASEIATLNLSGVDLVTLSACQTAPGDIVAGEGLQGSQRALLIAGARTSLTSLRSVEVHTTREIMDRFYRSAWLDRRSKADALQVAMIYMLRKYPWWSTASISAKGRRCPPWLWSSWVLYGDWR